MLENVKVKNQIKSIWLYLTHFPCSKSFTPCSTSFIFSGLSNQGSPEGEGDSIFALSNRTPSIYFLRDIPLFSAKADNLCNATAGKSMLVCALVNAMFIT